MNQSSVEDISKEDLSRQLKQKILAKGVSRGLEREELK